MHRFCGLHCFAAGGRHSDGKSRRFQGAACNQCVDRIVIRNQHTANTGLDIRLVFGFAAGTDEENALGQR